MYKNNYDAKKVGQRIRKIRKVNCLTQEKLAEKLLLSVDSISNFENGKQTCMPEHIVHMCELFSVSMDYFYFDNDVQKNINGNKFIVLEKLLFDTSDEDIERVEQMVRLFLKL